MSSKEISKMSWGGIIAERAKGAAWLHLEADDLTYLFEVVFPAAKRDMIDAYFEKGRLDDQIDELLDTKKRWLDSAKDKGYVGHPDD